MAADLNAEIDRCAQGAVTDFYGREKRLDEDALDKFRQLLEETTVVAGADEALLSMMGDEAAYFFAGRRKQPRRRRPSCVTGWGSISWSKGKAGRSEIDPYRCGAHMECL